MHPNRSLLLTLLVLTALVPWGMYAFFASAGEAEAALFRATPQLEQIVLAGAVYPIKFAYMALAFAAVALLWGQVAPRLAALRWAMVFFLIGELICWVNIIAFEEEHLLLEYLHSWGMVVCIGYVAFAALGGGPAHPRIANLFQWLLPLVMVVALMPLTAPIAPVRYATLILGVARTLSHSVAMQWYELRYAGLAGAVLLGAAWLWSWRGGAQAASKILLCAGLGHLGFAFLRLTLFAVYRDNLGWFVFWEEATELLLVFGVLMVITTVRPDLAKLFRLYSGSP